MPQPDRVAWPLGQPPILPKSDLSRFPSRELEQSSLRLSVQRGRPSGSRECLEDTAKRLGLSLTCRTTVHPPKVVDNQDAIARSNRLTLGIIAHLAKKGLVRLLALSLLAFPLPGSFGSVTRGIPRYLQRSTTTQSSVGQIILHAYAVHVTNCESPFAGANTRRIRHEIRRGSMQMQPRKADMVPEVAGDGKPERLSRRRYTPLTPSASHRAVTTCQSSRRTAETTTAQTIPRVWSPHANRTLSPIVRKRQPQLHQPED